MFIVIGTEKMSRWLKVPCLGAFLPLALIIVSHVRVTAGAKFLFTATGLFSMRSHYMGLTTVTKELVERGHEVIFLTTAVSDIGVFPPNSYTANITYPSSRTEEELAEISRAKSHAMSNLANMTLLQIVRDEHIRRLWNIEGFSYSGCFELFRQEGVLSRLKREKVDMIITMPVIEICDAVIAAYLNTSFTVLMGSRRSPAFHEGYHGMPLPVSYLPFSTSTPTFTDHMDFLQRVQNAVLRYAIHPLFEYIAFLRPIGQLQALHDIRRDLSPWQIVSRADLWLCHHTLALEYANPTVPNWIPIAGYTIKDPSPLPVDLETFVEGSGKHGFIVFTMGSGARLTDDQLTGTFAKVFSELPQRVIWRHKGAPPRNLGKNTITLDWLPQSDLIAHPKARMLIYHGGSTGLHEAIHYGVPMLLFPLAGDQPSNAMLAAAKGIALVMDRNSIDEDGLRKNIQAILHEPRYKESAVKASAILRDRIASPLDRAIFWIEHVVKFGGDHLRTRATEMGFIQLHSLDVVAFLAAVCFIWIYLTYTILAKCCGVCRLKINKQKKE